VGGAVALGQAGSEDAQAPAGNAMRIRVTVAIIPITRSPFQALGLFVGSTSAL
jgi:hypothetical protein